MEIKISQKQSCSLIEILQDGKPASPQNPIDSSEYASVEFPEASGGLAIISGMPMSAMVMVALHYKNMFQAIAIANPRLGVAEVAHNASLVVIAGRFPI